MKKNTQTFIAVVLAVVVVIVLSLYLKGKASNSISNTVTPTQVQSAQVNGKTYTLSSVATHNTKTDCWMIINGKVYDVTSYVPNHNADIVQGCGKDATTLFEEVRKHEGRATSMLDKYLIGTLQN